LGVRLAATLVPPLAHDLAVAGEHGSHHRIRASRAATPLGELERPLEAHETSSTSRRYPPGTSRKSALPATRRSAPAARACGAVHHQMAVEDAATGMHQWCDRA